jgi:predicted phage terminase large subunit-like protein
MDGILNISPDVAVVDEIGPQPGPQEAFLSTPADICIFGGAAFGGKSFGLLLESVRLIDEPRYNAIIFRRESPQITAGGGLWDTAGQMFPHLGGRPKESKLSYTFPTNAFVRFTHLEHENDKLKHQGAQYVLIGFDELTHFTETQFWYILTRTRAPYGCDLRPYCRATTNPEADSWVRDLIQWWIDEETGYAIPERSGVLRWFAWIEDSLVWVNRDWVGEDGQRPRSLTFIPSYMEDNPLGMESNPEYKSNLMAQDRVTRERLAKGNWNITYRGGMFDPTWFHVKDKAPQGIKWVRYWDCAATEAKKEGDDPDYTAGALVGLHNGVLWIGDVDVFRQAPGATEERIQTDAVVDGHDVPIGIEEEKGGSGKYQTSHFQRNVLKGYEVHPDPVTGDKIVRAKPWASLTEHEGCYLVRAPWNRAFIAQAGAFPLGKKDQIDAVSGAYKMLTADERVWPTYTGKLFREVKIGWKQIEPENAVAFAVLVYHKDTGIYGACFFWGRRTRVLRVYGEIVHPAPTLLMVALDVKKKMVVPLQAKKGQHVLTGRVFGNDEMFGKGMDWKTLLRKKGVRIKPSLKYEENSSIMLARYLFKNEQVHVGHQAPKSDLAYRSWKKGIGGQPEKGYPLCTALCIAVSELRERGELHEPEILKPYGRKKQAIHRRMYETKGRSLVRPGKRRTMDDYLVR